MRLDPGIDGEGCGEEVQEKYAAVRLGDVWRQASVVSSEGGGDVRWMGAPWGASQLKTAGCAKWFGHIKSFDPSLSRDKIKMYSACFFAGEGMLRVGDVVTFTGDVGHRPYVGEIEVMFDVEPWECDEDGTWPNNAAVDVFVGRTLDDGNLSGSYSRATVLTRLANGSYRVQFEEDERYENVSVDRVRRVQESKKYVIVKWFFRPEETSLSEFQKDKLVGCKGEVCASDHVDITEVTTIDCARCLLTYITGETHTQLLGSVQQEHDDHAHDASTWDMRARKQHGDVLRPLHFCCAFFYDEEMNTTEAVTRRGSGKRKMAELESGDDIDDLPLLQAFAKKKPCACANTNRMTSTGGFTVVKAEKSNSSSSISEEKNDKRAKIIQKHKIGQKDAFGPKAASSTSAVPKNTISLSGKKGAQSSLSLPPKTSQHPKPASYLSSLTFLAKLNVSERPYIAVSLQTGITSLSRQDRQRRLDTLLNYYLKVYDGVENGVAVSIKRAREAEESVFVDVRNRVLTAEHYRARMSRVIDRVKKLPRRGEANEWSEEEEEVQVVDADMEAKQQMVSYVQKKSSERKAAHRKGSNTPPSTPSSRTPLSKTPSSPHRMKSSSSSSSPTVSKPTAGARGSTGASEPGFKAKVAVEQRFLRRIGCLREALSEKEACFALSGSALCCGILHAFQGALHVCTMEERAPQLHLEQFETVVNPTEKDPSFPDSGSDASLTRIIKLS